MKNFITKTFKRDVNVIYVDNGTTDDFQELIQAVINGRVSNTFLWWVGKLLNAY